MQFLTRQRLPLYCLLIHHMNNITGHQKQRKIIFTICLPATTGQNLVVHKKLNPALNYMVSLCPLSDVPVTVLSSMKVNAEHAVAERNKWFDAHQLLGIGLKHFPHISTTVSCHYIMNDEPGLVLENLTSQLSKLP